MESNYNFYFVDLNCNGNFLVQNHKTILDYLTELFLSSFA